MGDARVYRSSRKPGLDRKPSTKNSKVSTTDDLVGELYGERKCEVNGKLPVYNARVIMVAHHS